MINTYIQTREVSNITRFYYEEKNPVLTNTNKFTSSLRLIQ